MPRPVSTILRSLILFGLILAPLAVRAQAPKLPLEPTLNRMGLTMAWWGQASINLNRETVEFISSDETNVYIQGSTGVITAFTGETGRRLWSELLDAPYLQSFPVATNDEQLLVTVGTKLYSVDKMTGQMIWKLILPDHPSASPSLDQDRVYFGTSNGSVFTYDLREIRNLYENRLLPQYGEKARLWRFATSRQIVSPPIVAGTSLLFASQTGTAYGVSPENKTLKFQLETGGTIKTPLAVSAEYLFVADQNARMYCLNQNTGRVRWIFSGGTVIHHQPRVIGNRLYVIPHRRGLISIDVETGEELWRQQDAVEFVGASDNRIYASDTADNLLILDRVTGKLINALDLREYKHRVHNDRTDRLVMSTDGGTVISLREIGSEFPVFHNHPERRPILPELAIDANPFAPAP